MYLIQFVQLDEENNGRLRVKKMQKEQLCRGNYVTLESRIMYFYDYGKFNRDSVLVIKLYELTKVKAQ